ncbi:MAG: aldo/keto reductase [Candidatus Nealsonbacteria bacterium]|nr:aldo/keto reductase [Candidatus Nealsonbacteria bacterium]
MADNRLTRRQFVQTGAAGLAGGLLANRIVYANNPTNEKTDDIINYNEQMEYRRAGKCEWMISAVCLGGHWKRVDKMVPGLFGGGGWLGAKLDDPDFEKNRYDVVTQCIERGINYIDACTVQEVIMYSKALKGRRDKMHLGFSWYQEEMRSLSGQAAKAKASGNPKPPGWITKMLKQAMDNGFKKTGLDYVDVWRIVCYEKSSRHQDNEMEEMCEALAWAKKTGRARRTGISSHDRPHIKKWIGSHSDVLDVIVTPYTAKTRMAGTKVESPEEGDPGAYVGKMEDDSWENSLWYAMKKADVAWFGIKPFASGSMFKGDSSPGNPHQEEDDKIARLTLRAILTNPVITAPIPGMINTAQVDNVARSVLQRRALDVKEQAELDAATDRAFANLPYHYRWLNDWNVV